MTGDGPAVVFTASSAVLVAHPFLPRAQPPPATADLQMTVTTWNTADRLRAEDLIRVFRERDPDVLVMPETTASTVEDIVAGHPELPGLQVFTSVSQRDGIAPTTVLVSPGLAPVRADIERIGTSDHRVLTVSVRLDSPVSSVRSP